MGSSLETVIRVKRLGKGDRESGLIYAKLSRDALVGYGSGNGGPSPSPTSTTSPPTPTGRFEPSFSLLRTEEWAVDELEGWGGAKSVPDKRQPTRQT